MIHKNKDSIEIRRESFMYLAYIFSIASCFAHPSQNAL